MSRPRSPRERERVTVAAVHLARSGADLTLVLGFRAPRTTLMVPLDSDRPEAVALGVAGVSAPAPTVLLPPGGAELENHRDALLRALPRAEVLACDPAAAMKFLWFFRDHEDPLLLGHAAARKVTDATYPGRSPPDVRAGRRGQDRRRAFGDLREMLLEMGYALGVRPPIPEPSPAPNGWSLTRLAGLLDTVAALYAGLLHRWRSPLAQVTDGAPLTILELTDSAL